MECIIFRTRNWTTQTTDFYGVAVPVDFGGLGNNTDPFFLEPALKTDRPSQSAFVSLGSSLFCVGGNILTHTLKGLTKIYQLDAAAGEADLMMLTPRGKPSVVAMDGKLYIMGGNIFRSKGTWGECFDLCSKKSSPLPLPPPLPPSGGHLDDWNDVPFVVAPLHFYKQILVVVALPSASNVAVVYHVEDKVWKKLDHEMTSLASKSMVTQPCLRTVFSVGFKQAKAQ